ncbi:MAG TPA: LysR family transcriptional regulator [Roseateles sp.]|nr:LysR family transcriptional regulator [Roseateles sp.]
MKLEDIVAFVAVVRAQSLSQAAKDLGLTQPAITRRVQNLEESLGVELLDRNTKPPRPNATGRLVLDQCRAVLEDMDRLRELVASDAEPSGDLRLGLTQGIGELALPGLLDMLAEPYPELRPQLVTGWGGQLLERLAADELDAAVAWLPEEALLPKKVGGRRLDATRLVVVAPADEPLRRSYRLADLRERGWILNPDGCGFRTGLRRALSAQGLPLHVRLDTNGRELQLDLVARGHGLGLVPLPLLERSAHRERLAVVPVSDFKPRLALWLLHAPQPGRLQGPVELFAKHVLTALQAAAPQRRRA